MMVFISNGKKLHVSAYSGQFFSIANKHHHLAIYL